MNLLLILAHPEPSSLNHAMARMIAEVAVGAGHSVVAHDLYAEGFDPVMPASELARDAELGSDIERYCLEAEGADLIVVVHPNWWSAPPAFMRGWTDRCLRAGRAYRFVPDGKGGAKAEGLLKAGAALVINTANTPQEIEEGVLGDPLQVHWLKVVFGLCGVRRVLRRNFAPVIASSAAQRADWLREVRRLTLEALELAAVQPLSPSLNRL
jgi:putative NADPH-quinone reductase